MADAVDLVRAYLQAKGYLTVSESPVAAFLETDPILGGSPAESDMIVAEVKEGRAELNRAARDPRVLETAFVRFGCCTSAESSRIVKRLLRTGMAATEHGRRIRLAAFGATVPASGTGGGYTTIPIGHVVAFLRAHVRENRDVLRHAQVSDPALRFLRMLEKAEGSDAG